MIKSMNKEIDDNLVQLFIEEVDDREELICLWNACAIAFNFGCAGQACGLACIGISICVAGLHTL